MKWIVLGLITSLQGCAVYTAAQVGSYIATDKTISDHASSTLVNADCNAAHVITKDQYYCEYRDIGKTYNRNPF